MSAKTKGKAQTYNTFLYLKRDKKPIATSSEVIDSFWYLSRGASLENKDSILTKERQLEQRKFVLN
jgi:hypothetical protein